MLSRYAPVSIFDQQPLMPVEDVSILSFSEIKQNSHIASFLKQVRLSGWEPISAGFSIE